ncbi:MAG: hypothetical protein Q8R79_07845 [Legionellaceae bacterium]|nr:hypothetical protein [Legionellaceae bacterium]
MPNIFTGNTSPFSGASQTSLGASGIISPYQTLLSDETPAIPFYLY